MSTDYCARILEPIFLGLQSSLLPSGESTNASSSSWNASGPAFLNFVFHPEDPEKLFSWPYFLPSRAKDMRLAMPRSWPRHIIAMPGVWELWELMVVGLRKDCPIPGPDCVLPQT